MDELPLAEELPTLYRRVLDAVVRLERAGDRAFAWQIRDAAREAYSGSWDERGRRRLHKLGDDARRRLAVHSMPGAAPSLSPSSEPA